jgi:WhiB family redox-sensing transcriptional regulator
MRAARQTTGVSIEWDVRGHNDRVAPTEDELWDHADRVHGAQDLDWLTGAACSDSDPELFFPSGPGDLGRIAAALACCRDCGVRANCLAGAMADQRTTGVWGGTTEWERAAMHARARGRDRATRPWQGERIDLGGHEQL